MLVRFSLFTTNTVSRFGQLKKDISKHWISNTAHTPLENNTLGQAFRSDWQPRLTFTPYANPLRCSAHCHYCSEDLKELNYVANSSPKNLIRDDMYYSGLEKCIDYIKQNFGAVDLSFSGLEATLDKKFYYSTLSAVARNDIFPYKTLYTNGSGIVMHNLDLSMFNKIELHRDHYDENKNQKIMRFEQKYTVKNNNDFITLSAKHKNLWLVCMLSKFGVRDIDDMTNYIAFAKDAGFNGVIFRELSKFNNKLYDQNYTLNWINNNRVLLGDIKKHVDGNPMFTMIDKKAECYTKDTTYTYQNFTFVMQESNWNILNKLEDEQKIHKLVYFSNGNLCNGWNPNENIIKNFGNATKAAKKSISQVGANSFYQISLLEPSQSVSPPKSGSSPKPS